MTLIFLHGGIKKKKKSRLVNLSNLKAFADKNSNEAEIMGLIFNKAENIVINEENVGYGDVFLFRLCFNKHPSWRSLTLYSIDTHFDTPITVF